jgi:hypothetical protein
LCLSSAVISLATCGWEADEALAALEHLKGAGLLRGIGLAGAVRAGKGGG